MDIRFRLRTNARRHIHVQHASFATLYYVDIWHQRAKHIVSDRIHPISEHLLPLY